jgi:histidine ammonia-lyase
MVAAQALDFRDYTPGRGTLAAKDSIRKSVKHLDEDRPLYQDHNAMMELVRSRTILDAVEGGVGMLGTY